MRCPGRRGTKRRLERDDGVDGLSGIPGDTGVADGEAGGPCGEPSSPAARHVRVHWVLRRCFRQLGRQQLQKRTDRLGNVRATGGSAVSRRTKVDAGARMTLLFVYVLTLRFLPLLVRRVPSSGPTGPAFLVTCRGAPIWGDRRGWSAGTDAGVLPLLSRLVISFAAQFLAPSAWNIALSSGLVAACTDTSV